MTLIQDVEVLRQIPLFAKVEPAKLKLLAFTSERLQHLPGDELFHQGDYGDAVYIILDGRADILVDSPKARSRSRHSAETSSARSRSCATCRAPRQWSPTATWRPCACRRIASSIWSRSSRRLASK
jgi:hypothetical protein